MNERIKELAVECTFFTYGVNGELLYDGFNEEKFAELIIQECLTAIDNTNIHHVHTSYDHNLVMATIEKSKMAVKEHFGM